MDAGTRTPAPAPLQPLAEHTPGGILFLLSVKWYVPAGALAPAFTAVQPQHPLILRPGMETDMCGTETRTQLPLASSTAAGCSCCSTDSSPAPTGAGAVEFSVEGLTCGHCVQTVEKAVSALDGVESASVELVPGGRSRLVVGGKADSTAVGAAVTAAGYTLASS